MARDNHPMGGADFTSHESADPPPNYLGSFDLIHRYSSHIKGHDFS